MTALDRLAERCGIQHVSEDAFGKEHVTNPETKRALLAAMHVAAGDEAQAQASLDQMEAEEWDQRLPPVLVVRSDKPVSVPVIMPAGGGVLRWFLRFESEGDINGTVAFEELPLVSSCSRNGTGLQRRRLTLPDGLPWGYHQLCLQSPDAEDASCSLIVSPGTCWLPPRREGGRLWGLAAQLYLVRSERNWGVGDFTDLRGLVTLAKENGADAVGINPLHAMFPDKPEDASPYSPSDRLLLNVLNIDIEQVPELASSEEARSLIASPAFQAKLDQVRGSALVQYKAVADLKLPVLRMLFSAFEQQPDPSRLQQMNAFHEERRELLDRACVFQALRQHFTAGDSARADCKDWPSAYQSSNSPEVARFAEEHADLVQFQLWLQWVADTQLRAAQEAAEGMAIGLYRDLAVGAHPSGAEVWSNPDALVSQASVGAPPDLWNPAGQNWGLPPLHPREACRHGYRSFIDLLQANMRYAGALRIDHALALQRLYWIPEGKEAKDGAYVQYPTDDLIGILALESHRNHCLVIGEDLGTVPKGFRERMAQANVLSYRVLFFERDEETFLSPDTYPELSLSVASSHDLPTLRGWWQGTDLDLKERLHLFPDPEQARSARSQREEDRALLTAALRKQGLLQSAREIGVDEFCEAAHSFLLQTRSLLTLLQVDDITKETEQVNMPSTTGENPNWRRKLSLTLEELARDRSFSRIVDTLRQPTAT